MPVSPYQDILLANLVNGDSLWQGIASQLCPPHMTLWLYILVSPLGLFLYHQSFGQTPDKPIKGNDYILHSLMTMFQLQRLYVK
jgi:hypothetical protein